MAILSYGQVGWRSAIAAPLAPLLLDTYTGAAAAYSLRKLRTAYTGAAIRVRRSSDSTTLDVGFKADGTLDTTAMLSFVGAGNGFVSIWYDQSGNGSNLIQNASANQARIVFGGILDTLNNKPALASNTNSAPNARYSATLTSISASPFTLFHVGSNNGSASGYLFDGANGTNRINGRSFNTTSIQVGKSGNVIQLNYTQNITTQRIINAVLNNTSSKLSINNGSYTTGTTGTLQGLSGLTLGAAYDFTQGATAYYQEHIIYPSDQSSNVTNIDTNINSFYTIY